MRRLWKPGWPRRLTVCAALLFFYTVSGFFILPLILKSLLVSELNSKLNAKVEIGSVAVNPFALSVSVNEFKSSDENQNSLLTFDKLYLNFQTRSLLEQALTFSSIKLENPSVRIGRMIDGTFNLDNIVKESPEPKNNDKSSGPELVFDKIEISSGNVLYFDEQKNNEFKFELVPLKLTLLDFRTNTDKGAKITFETSNNKLNEVSVDGNFSLKPLKADGILKLTIKEPGPVLKYALNQINISPVQAEIDLEAHLQFDGSSENSNLLVQTNKFDIRNVEVTDSAKKSLVKLPTFSTNINFNLKDQLLKISDLKASSGEVFVMQGQDGKFNFASLISSEEATSQESKETSAQEQNEFGIVVEKAKLEDFKINFETPAEKLQLKSASLSVDEFDSKKSGLINAHLDASLSEGGDIKLGLNGELDSQKLRSDVSLSRINLNQFSPWLLKILNVKQESGTLGADVSVTLDQKTRVNGKLDITDFALKESSQANKLVAWKKATISKFEWSSDSNQLQIENVSISNPDVAMRIDRSGTFVFIEATKESTTPPKQTEPKKSSSEFSYKVKNIKIDQGQIAFRDESTEPTYNVKLTNFNTSLKNIDSEFKKPLLLSLKSDLDQDGHIAYEGEVALTSSFIFQNATMTVKDLNLVNLSPYSVKFIGRGIDAGKLFAELKSEVSGDQINGLNKITLDNFYLGSEVHGESATGLPISTALSIMRDSSGKIVLDLPVSGDVTTAGVSYRSLLYQSFENLVLEVIASPITVLASIYDFDSEELSHVDFKAESNELGDEETKKLDIIKQALSDKDELKLEIRANVAAGLDTSADVKEWDDTLRELAKTRAEAIKNYVSQNTAIGSERIYIVAPEITLEAKEKLVATTLKLSS